MNISISADIERLLKKKVEAGTYPSQEAAVEAALARFLADDQEPLGAATRRETRVPGPFLEEDEAAEAAFDSPRLGEVVHRSCVWDEGRPPNPTPSE